MSIRIMTAAWSVEMSATLKLVLLALADNANDEGHCYPSVTTLTRKCGLSERAIRGAVAELESAGHVTRSERPGRSTIYRVHPCTTCTPAADAPLHLVHPPLQELHHTPAPGAPITIIEPSLNRKRHSRPPDDADQNRRPTPHPDQSAPPEGLDLQAWDEWAEYRHEIGKPFKSAKAIRAAQRKLVKFGTDQAAVVEESIASEWRGLFALKDAHDGGDAAARRRRHPG